jgi:Anti-sigma-K factor rskA/Putative zinc-finger
MTSPDIHALTGAYALDAVSGMERTDFERHLAECESCTQEVLELQETAARLALAATETPPAELKSRVLNDIRSVRQLPPETTVVPLRRRSLAQRLTTVAAAVFFVATAGLGVVVVQQNNQLDDARAAAAQMQDILSAPDAKLITLEDTGAGGNGTMKVAWSRSQDRVLFVSGDLASPREGKTYQLWATAGAGTAPRSLGLIEPTNGQVVKELSGIGGATGVAISVEPDTGSTQPTPDAIVMTGDLQDA